ncbi:MAG: serine/threonine protein kinase [Myxococcales bacterium]|nr:serine/threonine protein kinase [Myxococcales bacterium]
MAASPRVSHPGERADELERSTVPSKSPSDKSSGEKPTVVDGGSSKPNASDGPLSAPVPSAGLEAKAAVAYQSFDSYDSEEVEMLDELLGATLHDTYRLVGLLGEGGMSRVYEGQHTRIEGKRYAIKVLRSDMVSHGEVARRFRREAKAVASVSHPNVLDIYDIGETPDGRPYLVTEFLTGESLGDRLDRERVLTVSMAAHVVRSVCAGVAAAHEVGVIHRDLKPDNVFLVGDPNNPQVKVLDFGLARLRDTDDSNLTRTGVVMGTPGYMSPEQARGERVDFRTDIYGVGAILYASLTGRAPYERETFQMTVLAVMNGDPLRPRAIDPNIPATLEVMIQKAMARDPAERYANLEEFSMALERFDETAFNTAMTALAPARAPQISELALAEQSTEAESARVQLTLLSLLGLVLVNATLVTAVISALELFVFKRSATGVELGLVVGAIVGTTATPAILAYARVRKNVWNNSARVIELLGTVRAVLVAGGAAYGLAAIVVRIYDGLISIGQPSLGRAVATGWAGWSSVFFVVAALAGGAALLRRLLLRSKAGRVRKFLVGPLLVLLTLAGMGAVLRLGFHSGGVASQRMLAELEAPGVAPGPAVSSEVPAPAPSVADAADAGVAQAPRSRTATAAELGAAKAKGLAGLLPLRQRYPEDPDVLRPLAVAFGEDPRTYNDAIATLKQLFKLVPKDATDRQLRTLVIKIAATGKSATEPALELMSKGMGTAGPDILYDLYLTSNQLRPRIQRILEDKDVRAVASPAMLIAYDLRSADSCAARVPLLERAKKDGDERSVATLQMLSSRTKKGCGYRKRKPCPAPCGAQVKQFVSAVGEMQKRMEAEEKAVERGSDAGEDASGG